jgi:hypothetical protein
MRIISWNCRGLGNASTVCQGKQIALFWKPDFFFVLETCLTKGKGNKILSNWGFTGSSEVPRVGLRGGLALGWTQAWDVLIIFQNSRFIHSEITNMHGEIFAVTFLYGHPNLAHRHLIWHDLLNFGRQIHHKWICIGDFHQVLRESNKLTFKEHNLTGNIPL